MLVTHITCTNVDTDGLRTLCADTDVIHDHIDYYEGFRYASPLDLNETDVRFIVARDQATVIGILKYARFTDRGYARASEGTPNSHLGIYYIDVREDRRRQNVSRKLIDALRQTTSPPHIVELSPLTKNGKQAKLVETFQRHFTVRRVGR